MPTLSETCTIRPATEADTEAIVALGITFLRESSYATEVAENPAQMARVVRFLLEAPTGTVLVAEHGGTVIGMIGLVIVPHVFSGVSTAGELAFFIHPDHRGTSGVRLLKAAESWAREQGAKAVSMIAPSARVSALYERMGYSAIETNYTKRI